MARSAEAMGEDAHILKVFFEPHLSPEKIQEINGLVGAGATAVFARLNGFQQVLVKYQGPCSTLQGLINPVVPGWEQGPLLTSGVGILQPASGTGVDLDVRWYTGRLVLLHTADCVRDYGGSVDRVRPFLNGQNRASDEEGRGDTPTFMGRCGASGTLVRLCHCFSCGHFQSSK